MVVNRRLHSEPYVSETAMLRQQTHLTGGLCLVKSCVQQLQGTSEAATHLVRMISKQE